MANFTKTAHNLPSESWNWSLVLFFRRLTYIFAKSLAYYGSFLLYFKFFLTRCTLTFTLLLYISQSKKCEMHANAFTISIKQKLQLLLMASVFRM